MPIFWVGLIFNCPRPSHDGEEDLGQVLLRKWQKLLFGTVPIFWVGPVFNYPRPSRDGEEALGQVLHYFHDNCRENGKDYFGYSTTSEKYASPHVFPLFSSIDTIQFKFKLFCLQYLDFPILLISRRLNSNSNSFASPHLDFPHIVK